MKTRADSVRELKEKNSTLQQLLSTTQQKLNSLADAKALSGDICRQLEIKQENDYFVMSHLIEHASELKTMYAEIKASQQTGSTLEEDVMRVHKRLDEMGEEAKKPDEKRVLDTITNALKLLLTPKDCKPVENATLDTLLQSATRQLDASQFKKDFDEFMRSWVSHEKKKKVRDYIEIKQVAGSGKKNAGRALLTKAGIDLVSNVKKNGELEREIKQCEESMAEREEKIRRLEQETGRQENFFLEKVSEQAKKAKDAAENLCEEWKAASNALCGFPVSKLKKKVEFIIVCYLGMEDENRDNDFLEKMQKTLDEIDGKMESEEASTANEAINQLAQLGKKCKQNEKQFGQARVWSKLSREIKANIDQEAAIREGLSNALQTLRQQKTALELSLKEKTSQPKRIEESETIAQVVPVSAPVSFPRIQQNNVNPFYKRATEAYLERLSDSIKEHLEIYEKVAKNRYDHLAVSLGLTGEFDVDSVARVLKEAYKQSADQELQETINTILVPKRNEKSKPETEQEKKEKQESLQCTLHKYRLMTELLVAADESSDKFLSVLRRDDSREVLSKRRDSWFILWARRCGSEVARMLGVVINVSHSVLFSVEGQKFSKQFKDHQPVGNPSHDLRSRRVGG